MPQIVIESGRLTVGVLTVVAGCLGLVVSIVQVQANAEHRTALFLSIDRGSLESIAQRESFIDLPMTIVLTGYCSPILKGDREGAFNGDRGICNAGHFGSEVPGEWKERIEAAGVIRVSNIGQGFNAQGAKSVCHEKL